MENKHSDQQSAIFLIVYLFIHFTWYKGVLAFIRMLLLGGVSVLYILLGLTRELLTKPCLFRFASLVSTLPLSLHLSLHPALSHFTVDS